MPSPGAALSTLHVFLPPQHLVEGDAKGNAWDQLGVVGGGLAGETELIFRLPQRGIPLTLEALLDWCSLEPVVAANALPPVQSVNSEQPPKWTTLRTKWNAEAGRVEVMQDGPTLVAPATGAKATQIEFPTGGILSPHEWLSWRSAGPITAERTVFSDAAEDAHREQSNTQDYSLWHTTLVPGARLCDGTFVEADLPALMTVRMIGVNERMPHEPQALPALRELQDIAATSSNFGFRVGNAPVIPTPITVERLMLTSLGASADLKFSADLDVYNGANRTPGAFVNAWTQRSDLGRDTYVMVSYDCRTMPLGTKASLINIRTRAVNEKVPGKRPVAGLSGAGEVESDPSKPLPPTGENSTWFVVFDTRTMDYSQFGSDDTSSLFRQNGFIKARVKTPLTPQIQINPPHAAQDTAIWIKPLGSDAPMQFEVELTDRQGVETTHFMPLFLVIRTKAVIGESGDYTSAKDAFHQKANHQEANYRKVNFGGQRVAVVAPPANLAPGGDDGAVEVETLTWDINDAVTLTGEPLDTLHAWPLKYFPKLDSAELRMAAASAFSRPDAAAPVTTSMTWDARYVDHGFEIAKNGAQVFFRLVSGADMPLVNFHGGKGGGLATPSMAVTHLSRIFGPVSDEGALPAPAPGARMLAKGVTDGKFDPNEFFSKASALAKLIGGVDLTEVIAPVENAIDELARVPKLIEQQLRPVITAVETVRQKGKEVIAAIESLDGVEVPVTFARMLPAELAKPVTLAHLRYYAVGELAAQRAKFEKEVSERIIGFLVREAAPLQQLIDTLWRMLTTKEAALLAQMRAAVNGAVDRAAADERVRRAFELAFQAEAVLRELRQLRDTWSTPATWTALITAYQQEAIKQLKTTLNDRAIQNFENRVNDNIYRFFTAYIDEALLYRQTAVDYLTDLQLSLPRAREALLAPLVPLLTVSQAELLRAAFDAQQGFIDDQHRQWQSLVREITTKFQEVSRQIDLLGGLFATPVQSAYQAIKEIIKTADDRPMELFGKLVQALKKLLADASRAETARTSAKADIAAGRRPATLSTYGPAQRLLDDQRNQLNQLIEKKIQEIKAADGVFVALQKHILNAISDVGSHIPSDPANQDPWKTGFHRLQLSAADYLNVLNSKIEQKARAIQDAVTGMNGVELAVYQQLQPLAAAVDGMIDSFEQKLTELKTTVAAAIKTIESLLEALPQEVAFDYDWSPHLQDAPAHRPIFKASRGGIPATFDFSANIRKSLKLDGLGQPPQIKVSAVIRNFELILLPSINFVTVGFDQISFISVNGAAPKVNPQVSDVTFGDALEFVKQLASFFNPKGGPKLELAEGGLKASYGFDLPSLTLGALNVTKLGIGTALHLPFDGSQVLFDCSVSTRANPFMVSVGVLGGGGFFGLTLSPEGVHALEASIEFGATVDLGFALAKGEGKIVAGIYFSKSAEQCVLTGYVEASGTLRVIGLINVTLLFYLGLSYEKRDGRSFCSGTVIVIVEIEMLFFSVSVKLMCYKEFAGSGGGPQSVPPTSPSPDDTKARLDSKLSLLADGRHAAARAPAPWPALKSDVPPLADPRASRVRRFHELKRNHEWKAYRDLFVSLNRCSS